MNTKNCKNQLNLLKRLFLFLAVFVSIVLPGRALADNYEEEEEYHISVDKKVSDTDANWVDNLGIEDEERYFFAEDTVYYLIKVTNASDKDLDDVKVKDTFPGYIDYNSVLYAVGGEAVEGSWDGESRALSWTIDKLAGGESREYKVTGKVAKRENLFEEIGTRCDNENRVRAEKSGEVDEDTANVCIKKGVLEEIVPQAGPAETTLIAVSSVVIGLAGWVILKKSYQV